MWNLKQKLNTIEVHSHFSAWTSFSDIPVTLIGDTLRIITSLTVHTVKLISWTNKVSHFLTIPSFAVSCVTRPFLLLICWLCMYSKTGWLYKKVFSGTWSCKAGDRLSQWFSRQVYYALVTKPSHIHGNSRGSVPVARFRIHICILDHALVLALQLRVSTRTLNTIPLPSHCHEIFCHSLTRDYISALQRYLLIFKLKSISTFAAGIFRIKVLSFSLYNSDTSLVLDWAHLHFS